MIPRRLLSIGTLILAGELIFGLPFHVPRFFRPTVLEVFGLSNAQLGDLFAVYGITATLAYFLGGPLADRFSARNLMAASLFSTGAGGLYLLTIPGPTGMAALYAYWGLTTILLFWAALIRATRMWGGSLEQGRAFGLLDGGRGLAAAVLSNLAVVAFARFLSPENDVITAGERASALRSVIATYTAATIIAGIFCWRWIPHETNPQRSRRARSVADVSEVVRMPHIWAQAMIVVCAYCGYKGLDNYALYAVQVLGMSELDAARLTSFAAYIRVFAPIAAGLMADRLDANGVIAGLFIAMALSFGALSEILPAPGVVKILCANIFISYVAVFALRGVYFALLEETRVPENQTGTAVGLISVVGFTPEIFFGPISGRILDNSPGAPGHLHYFVFLTGISAFGALTALVLAWLMKKASAQPAR